MATARSRTLVLLFAFIAPAAAGCFGGDDSGLGDPRHLESVGDAKLSMNGWAYDGQGLTSVAAALAGDVNNAENAGSLIITLTTAAGEMRIEFDDYREGAGKAFQDGGVAFDLNEHGDTGVADASIPRILALVAAWGEARVNLGGNPLLDPNTGGPTWSAHVMASDTTVRGTDGLIAKADGTTPYDPAAPADARRVEGDRQLLLSLKPHDRAAEPTPVNETKNVNVASPDDVQTFPVASEFGAVGTAVFTFSGAGGAPVPLQAGDIVVTVTSPSGVEVGRASAQITPQGAAPVEVTWAGVEAGDYVVQAQSRGAFTYAAQLSTSYPPASFMTLTWDDFEIS